MAKILVACEYSGTVRDAFAKEGHSVVSCDLLPTESPGLHYQGDVLDLQNEEFDLVIAHPPCTHLAISGARWFKDKEVEQKEALEFFKIFLNWNAQYICVENPISIVSSRIRKPNQIIQPWMFGHSVSKSTCLWTKNLPLLQPTNVVDKGDFVTFKSGKRMPAWYNISPSNDRWKQRSKTFPGIAEAMAKQWGPLLD